MTLAAMTDAALAAHLAAEAGRSLIDVRENSGLAGKALGVAGDAAANRYLCDAIRTARPDDGLLSEEEKDNPARLARSRVWIVDPVDGTREYSEGRGDWAVHVALSVDGAPVLGAVALPGLAGDVVLRSDQPQPLGEMAERPRFLVSRTRPAREAEEVAAALGGELVPMGSAGVKTLAVLRGEADVYLHQGNMHEWDSGAPAAVAQAAGLWVSRVDGSPLVFNQPRPLTPDILICHPGRAPALLAAIAPLL